MTQLTLTDTGDVAYSCDGCGQEHRFTAPFLSENLPDDLDTACSFCGAAGPSLADIRAAKE